jgi:adenylosuccinate synthase
LRTDNWILGYLCLKIEISKLHAKGIKPKIIISDRATLVLPIHRLEDELEEGRLGSEAFGSTRNGIAYAYADRHAKKALQVGLFHDLAELRKQLRRWYDWKIPMLTGLYGQQDWPSYLALLEQIESLAEFFSPMVGNTIQLQQSMSNSARILLEAQLGSLRDINFGNYPYVTSSAVLSTNAEQGSGLYIANTPRITAVVKAFSSCIGDGPFPTAMAEMTTLRESANEFGARTGRAREMGHFDGVATAYGVQLQKATEVALTKLDCLSGLPELKLCIGYELNGKRLNHYPLAHELKNVKPTYKTMRGWDVDITNIREFKKLPVQAKEYILACEKLINCPIRYVSVGPERNQLIER